MCITYRQNCPDYCGLYTYIMDTHGWFEQQFLLSDGRSTIYFKDYHVHFGPIWTTEARQVVATLSS